MSTNSTSTQRVLHRNAELEGAVWDWSPFDEQMAQRLQQRLPARVFDAHGHVYRKQDFDPTGNAVIEAGPDIVDIDLWFAHTARQVGSDRLVGGLFFPFPKPDCDADAANDWLIGELDAHPDSRGLALVRPNDDPSRVRELLAHPSVVGIKVYHVYSEQQPTFESSIDGFLPDWMWEICNDVGGLIMLHMVRMNALADPRNQEEIIDCCERYPNAKLVLAHAARGFNKWDTVEGIDSIAHLDNVWFDTSACCEPEAITAILHAFGPGRLMWAGDFPITEMRGKAVSVGEAFSWIDPPSFDGSNNGASPIRRLRVGLESLRAVIKGLDDFSASQQDFEDVFYNTAAKLVGVEEQTQNTGQQLYEHAKQRIPGGVHLLSKRPENALPNRWPAYFSRAKGCYTWDMDGNRYTDMSTNGIGAMMLGFNDPDVTRAVRRSINMGTKSTLNVPEEVELADRLCEIHPWAERVRMTRAGGETASVAVRIARATTGKSKVAICGYHGWHDWYLAANLGDGDGLEGHLLPGLQPLGVPAELRGTAMTFAYGDQDAAQKVFDAHGDKLACVVMEPMRSKPDVAFLQKVRELATKHGVVLCFDEITIGWRTCFGGAHLNLGVMPDMALFAKSLSNGYPMGAVIGTADAMTGAKRSFISSTYWTEAIGPVAALATLEKMQRIDAATRVNEVGERILRIWQTHTDRTGLPIKVEDSCPALAKFSWQHEQALALQTLHTKLMLDHGYLAGQAVYCTTALDDEKILAQFNNTIGNVFDTIADALERGENLTELAGGTLAEQGFGRLVQ